jgi:hypothetical protein
MKIFRRCKEIFQKTKIFLLVVLKNQLLKKNQKKSNENNCQ